jgi:hypothetical protein
MSQPNSRYYPGIYLEALSKTKNPPDVNPEPPQYEAGMLATRPRRSVNYVHTKSQSIILSPRTYN